jgi:hypothetical protein
VIRPAATLVALLVLASVSAPLPAAAQSPIPISDEARAKFNVGVTLLKDPEGPRYEEAYRAFKQAYAASPSSKILGNLGLCAMKLERDDEAITAYDKYLTDLGKDMPKDEAKQIADDLAILKASVAHVTIESDPPGAEISDARIPVRGERVLNGYGVISQATKLGLHEGVHQLTARLAGYTDQTWDFEVVGGKDLPPHKFVFKKEEQPAIVTAPTSTTTQPPPPPPTVSSRPVPGTVWAGVAVTGAFAAGTVVTSIIAMGNHNSFENAVSAKNTSQESSFKSTGDTMNIVNDVCVGGTVVGAVVTAVLFFTRPTVTEPASAGKSLQVVPVVGASSGGLSVLGTF